MSEQELPEAASTSRRSMKRAALIYTFARFGLFALIALILWLAAGAFGKHLNGLPLLGLTALLSMFIGYPLFARQRAMFAQAIEAQRSERADAAAERQARIDRES